MPKVNYTRGGSSGINSTPLENGQILFDREAGRIMLDAVVNNTLTRITVKEGIFDGTSAEWDALTDTQKELFKYVNITDDYEGGGGGGDASPDEFYALVNDNYSEQIATNDDLDDYTSSGTYICSTDAIAATLSNSPTSIAFKMMVDVSDVISQTVYAGNYMPWRRTKVGNAWGEWKQYVQKNELVTQVGVSIPSNTDLNTYKTAGTYRVTTDNTAATLSNLPLALCGKVLVFDNGNGGYTQFYIPNHQPKLFMRNFWSKAWTNWIELAQGGNEPTPADFYALSDGSYTALIQEDDDLDDYTSSGTYVCATDTVAASLSNCPVTSAFKLMVDVEGNADIASQIITMVDETDTMPFYRVKTSDDVWGDWKQIVSPEYITDYGKDYYHYLSELDAAHRITANQDLNDYTASGTYQCINSNIATTLLNCPVGNSFKLVVDRAYTKQESEITQKITMRNNSANPEEWIRVKNYNASTWGAWQRYASTNNVYSLRGGIYNSLISANDDLDTYTTAGTYDCTSAATAETLSNCPITVAFKMMVDVENNSNIVSQTITLINTNNINSMPWKRTKDSAGTWGDWRRYASTTDVANATTTNGYVDATVSGNAITATINDFQLKAGTIVAIKLIVDVTAACTLNISSTGAKPVKCWGNNDPTYGYGLRAGIVTLIYDGTNYRVISMDKTPLVNTQGYVANTSGNVLIDWGYGVNRAQLKHNIGEDKLKWNYYKNSSWHGDVDIADYDDIVHQTLGIDIPANSDLDDYKTNGVYNIPSNNIAVTIENSACGYAGKLVVMHVASDKFVRQIFITFLSMGNSDYYGVYERSYNGDTDSWREWKKNVVEADGVIKLYTETTTSDDKAVGIQASIADTTTGKTNTRNVLSIYQDHQSTPYGFNMVMESGGAMIIGSGEAGVNHYDAIKPIGNENMYLTSDSHMLLQAGGNTIANRKGFRLDTNGVLVPIVADVATNNSGSIGTSDYKLADIYTYKINGQDVIGVDNIEPAIAKVGKSILPSWSYTSNVHIDNGITYTFNPNTGEITANGTATANSVCILAGVDYSYYWLPKGTYTISGCPSGGSASTYYVCLNANGSFYDYGSSTTFTLTSDCESVNNEHFYIRVLNGQTVSNLVFTPMLRPSWTSADYEPCEDIHKGNCYVGTCTTGAGEQVKKAYVDGYFVLRKGVRVCIKFTNTNTYSATASAPCMLNVNSTGDKAIYYNNTATPTGTQTSVFGYANQYVYYVYDGTYWVWDGHGLDNNNTNYVLNNGSSTITANSPTLTVKCSDIDAQAADNGVTATKFPTTFNITDKNNLIMTRKEAVIETSGNISSFWYVRNYNGSTTQVGQSGIKLNMNKSGTLTYVFGFPGNANAALGCGFGTCSTAAATAAKVVTLANYTCATNGYVTVKFTNAVPANATMNINSQGAKSIYYHGSAITAGVIQAGDLATFIFDGTYYHLIGVDRNIADYMPKPTYLTQTLNAGSTTVTFTDNAISSSSLLSVYTSIPGQNYNSISVSSHTVTVVYDAQSSNMTVTLEVKNV